MKASAVKRAECLNIKWIGLINCTHLKDQNQMSGINNSTVYEVPAQLRVL